MNAIQQISLKLRLGIDPASHVQSDQLLQQWQAFNAHRCRNRSLQRRKEQNPDPLAASGNRLPRN